MDTPDDIAREQWMSELVDKVSKEAVDQSTSERLRSYYLENPDLAVKAIAAFREAEKLQEVSPTAALVLYTTAIELGLKVALLKPVLFGLVHNDSVADLVSDLAVKQNGFDRFKPILASILSEYAEVDFDAFTVEGHKQTIWADIADLQRIRNCVLHRGQTASVVDAVRASQVATVIFGQFFVSVLSGLGLKYLKGGRVANAQSFDRAD